MLDYLIQNATVFDGADIEPKSVSVGILQNKIAYVGDSLTQSSAKKNIDASGLYLCPGFIDSHASTGLGYMSPNAGDNKLFQGVTTEIIGNCGTSTAPVGKLLKPTMEELSKQIGFDFTWNNLNDWFEKIQNHGLPFNIGTYIGHSTLRGGFCKDIANVGRPEINDMCNVLAEAMQQGALGLSSGLVYAPGSFADTSELIDLAKIAAKHGGIYVSHIRNEREDLEDSVEEAITIGREAGLPVLVSHLKAAEKSNWGKISKVIEQIEKAQAEGVRVKFEVYPYAAVSTKLRTFIPKSALEHGISGLLEKLKTEDWRKKCTDWLEFRRTDYNSMILITESIPGSRGKSILTLSEQRRQPPAETAIDVLQADPDAWIVYHCLSQSDVDEAVLHPDSIICSDSWSHPVNAPNQIGEPHPRTYGAFTRFLENYALKNEQIQFGHAIQKVTSYAADWIGLPKRGRIQEGFYADLSLLDPKNVHEKATFDAPRQFSEGTEKVWVNGVLTLAQGEIRQELPGLILKSQEFNA